MITKEELISIIRMQTPEIIKDAILASRVVDSMPDFLTKSEIGRRCGVSPGQAAKIIKESGMRLVAMPGRKNLVVPKADFLEKVNLQNLK